MADRMVELASVLSESEIPEDVRENIKEISRLMHNQVCPAANHFAGKPDLLCRFTWRYTSRRPKH